MAPSISIAIPLFNKRSYIADSLASIAAQSFSDYEIVVVDDGSTDGSAAVVEALNLPSVKLIMQSNAGVSAARNRCLAESSSDFVAFLDADDIWRKDHLKHLWGLHLAHPDARLLANSYYEVSDTTARDLGSLDVSYRNISDFIAEAVAGQSPVFTSASMVHRDSCLSIGGFEVGESRGEDIDLWIRMGLRFPVAMSDYIGCLYRRVDNSLTTSRTLTEPDIAMRRIAEILDRSEDLGSSRKRDLKELYNRIAIANATDCLVHGRTEAASMFLALASDTRLFKRRWLLAKILCSMPSSALVGLEKMRAWTKIAREG